VTVNSKEENSENVCHNYVHDFGLCIIVHNTEEHEQKYDIVGIGPTLIPLLETKR
jgi:hypothetical protein